MIPIYKEPKKMFREFGVYEHCYFCNNPTDTWHNGTNQPVCKECAKTHKVSELVKSHPEYKPISGSALEALNLSIKKSGKKSTKLQNRL